MKRRVLPGAALAAFAFATSSHSTAADSPRTRAHATACEANAAANLTPHRFVFPRDDGAHDGYAIEWWRTFGRLTDLAGNAYDVSVNVSRYAIGACGVPSNRGAWAATHIVTSAYEMLDEITRRRARDVHVEREGPLGGHASGGRLELAIAGLHLSERAIPGVTHPDFSVRIRDARARISLDEQVTRAPFALGPGGIEQTGSCITCAAYAYAYTHNAARGDLAIDGVAHAVAGEMWLEHEFAHRELAVGDAGWDRFDVAFADGRNLDARFTRDASDNAIVAVSGAMISPNGRITYLDAQSAGESNFPPNAVWRSAASNIAYPSSWIVGGLDTSATIPDQELYAPGRPPYYMGAIDVQNQSGSGERGHGFVELTGYVAPASP